MNQHAKAIGAVIVGNTIFANLTTVISIIAGVAFLHEVFTPFQIVGAVIILISVFFANRQQGTGLETSDQI